MIKSVFRRYGELAFWSSIFVGAILVVFFAASALVTVLGGESVSFSVVPFYLKLWISMSLVLPLIMIGIPYLVATISSAISRIFG